MILDRDFNAMQETITGELAADAADIVGPCGTPDDGFKISLEPTGSTPILWSPPSPLSPPETSEQWDFLIAPGTMYIGGQRAAFSARSPGQTEPFSYSYFDQPDWINPPRPSNPVNEVVSLHLFEQEVCAVEDPDLLDVALGGPDTTQRVRLMRRIERCSGDKCADAAKQWKDKGFKLDPETMRLLPQVALQARFPAPAAPTNPCDPVATGGYLGAFNQLIRVETRNPAGGSPTLLWGYDNASFLYRVTAPASGSPATTLTLAQAPVDAFHQPVQNQVVEVLRMAAVLADDPNAIDPTRPILRCVAEARGHVTALSQAYATNSDGTGTVGLASLPTEYSNDLSNGRPLFLRIWQGQSFSDPTSASGIELVDFAGQSTNLWVTLTVPAGGALPHGAFWMIAVRPSTPQVVYPERFLESAQPPDGPHQWMCPLAVIDWSGGTNSLSPPAGNAIPEITQDCREKFCNLVGLTKRERAGCCTFRVGDGVNTFGDFTSVQVAIDSLPPEGGEICILAGRYFEAVTISKSNVVIHGCGQETRIASPSYGPKHLKNSGAVIRIENAHRVELRSLVIEAGVGDVGVLGLKRAKILLSNIRLTEVIVTATDQSAVNVAGNSVGVERCTMILVEKLGELPAVYIEGEGIYFTENWIGPSSGTILPTLVRQDLDGVTATGSFADGIQIGGSSRDVHLVGNKIAAGSGNGITLGSLVTSGEVQVVAGSLVNLHIENNAVTNMGLCGIGPVILYAPGDNSMPEEIVSISDLFILGNEVSNCPRLSFTRSASRITAAAICLPDVAGLVIRGNEIRNPGAGRGSAVSGVFLLNGEQVQISGNQITDGRTSDNFIAEGSGSDAAGIYILTVTPPASSTDPGAFESGTPALCIHDNIVTVRAGLALLAIGFGAFSIRGNQFATGGLVLSKAVLASGVFILNTGSALDALTLLADEVIELAAALAPLINNQTLDDEVAELITLLLLWLTFLELEAEGTKLGLDLSILQALYAQISSTVGTGPGPVIFSQNRVSVLSSAQKSDARAATAMYIVTFDDLGFHDNQCSLQVRRDQVTCDAFLFGMTARVTGNRFQETFGAVSLSLFAVGLLANISSMNIGPSGMFSSLGLQSVNSGNLPPSF